VATAEGKGMSAKQGLYQVCCCRSGGSRMSIISRWLAAQTQPGDSRKVTPQMWTAKTIGSVIKGATRATDIPRGLRFRAHDIVIVGAVSAGWRPRIRLQQHTSFCSKKNPTGAVMPIHGIRRRTYATGSAFPG